MGWLVVYNFGSWNHCDCAIVPELVEGFFVISFDETDSRRRVARSRLARIHSSESAGSWHRHRPTGAAASLCCSCTAGAGAGAAASTTACSGCSC